MPFSSSALIRVASVYRAGGWVKCCPGLSSFSASASPSFRSGRGDWTFSSSSSLPSTYTAVKPENFREE